MKNWLIAIAASLLAVSASAERPIVFEELEASPQLSSANISGEYMECYVDTPAWDEFRKGWCFSVGVARTTSAVFRIQGGPSSNFHIYWSDSRCSATSKTCVVPIRQYQNITMTADVLNKNNNTFFTVSAKAHYEGFH